MELHFTIIFKLVFNGIFRNFSLGVHAIPLQWRALSTRHYPQSLPSQEHLQLQLNLRRKPQASLYALQGVIVEIASCLQLLCFFFFPWKKKVRYDKNTLIKWTQHKTYVIIKVKIQWQTDIRRKNNCIRLCHLQILEFSRQFWFLKMTHVFLDGKNIFWTHHKVEYEDFNWSTSAIYSEIPMLCTKSKIKRSKCEMKILKNIYNAPPTCNKNWGKILKETSLIYDKRHANCTWMVGAGGTGGGGAFSSSELGCDVLSSFRRLTLVSRAGAIFSSRLDAWRALSNRSSDIVSAFWRRPRLLEGDPEVALNWNDLDLLVLPLVVTLVIFWRNWGSISPLISVAKWSKLLKSLEMKIISA